MSEGGLSVHRLGKELGAKKVGKGLSAKPRGLSLGNNILILFPEKDMCIFVYPKFLAKEGTCKGDARCGMHAVPRVTSVIPGACK
jgi:hypothetical protein